MKPEKWMTEVYERTDTNLICLARSDQDLCYEERGRSRFYPLEYTHPLVIRYEMVVEKIQMAFHSIEWRAIWVRRVGCHAEWKRNAVTVIGLTDSCLPDIVARAQGAVKAVQAILREIQLPDVQVHVACPHTEKNMPGLPYTGHGFFESDGERYPNSDNMELALHGLRPGTSISRERRDRCGSLGPIVRVQKSDGQHYLAAITAHHVLCQTSRPFDSEIDGPAFVECPSRADLEYNRARDCSALEDQDRILAQIKHTMDHEPHKDVCKRLSSQYELNKTCADSIRERLRLVDELQNNLLLGYMIASSGIREIHPAVPFHDWALIRVNPTKYPPEDPILELDGHDRLCAQPLPPPDKISGSGPVRSLLVNAKRADALTDFLTHCADRQRGHKVTVQEVFNQEEDPEDHPPVAFLYGRTSGFTAGYVNAINDSVRLTYTLDGRDVIVAGRQLTILDIKHNHFSRSGDSGSPVYDRYGRIIGMLISGNNKDSNYIGRKVSYVVTIDETMASIEKHFRDRGETVTIQLK